MREARLTALTHCWTSEFASRLIGQREIMHTTRSKTRRPTGCMGSTRSREHLEIEPAIMASEIEHLPDLEGHFKFASTPDWRRVTLTPVSYPTVTRCSRPMSAPAGTEVAAKNPGRGEELGRSCQERL